MRRANAPPTSRKQSMTTDTTVCAVLTFMMVVPMSSPKLWATSVVSTTASQLLKKAPAVTFKVRA